MAFEGLREQLKEQWADLSAKIQESPAFNNLREKFESQTPTAQRAIIGGAAGAVVIMLLMIPWGYISTSSDYMSQFEENRELIQGLLRASRSAKTPSPLPPPLDATNLRGRVDGILRTNRLMPDQIGDIQELPQPVVKDLVPATVTQTGLAVQIKRLNLKQIITLANQFQNMGSGTKLMGVSVVQSQGQTHYYDMIAKVVNFGLPEIADAGPEEDSGAGKKRPRAKPSRDEDTGE